MKCIKLNMHSIIDVITNSSSEIFITNMKIDEKIIKKILDKVKEEFGCTAVEFNINPAHDDDYNEVPGVFDILYDYEYGHEPCKMMKKKIEEVFGKESEYES